MTERRRQVERDSRVDDPEFSPEAKELLTAEQRTARAPSGREVAPLALPILAVAGSLAVGIVATAILGGVAWIGALLLLGAAVGWSLLEIEVARDGRRDEHAFEGDAAASRRRLIPTLVIVAAVVAAGVIIVGALAGYL